MGIGTLTTWLFVSAAWAQTTPPSLAPQAQTTAPAATAPASPAKDDAGMTREEILALFQREARAAYQMNKEACQALPTDDQKICLARARLQFDADMRYAQKRADQGY